MKKLSSIIVLFFVLLVSSHLTLTKGFGSSASGSGSQVYDIDYRGPETHSHLPPPNRFGRNPFDHRRGSPKPKEGIKGTTQSQTNGK